MQCSKVCKHHNILENKEKDNTTDHEEICGHYTGTAIFPKTNADKQWLTGWTYPVKMH